MGERLYVSTRKGLFTLGRDGGWRIERRAFIGSPVTMTLLDGREETLYAALRLGHFGVKLHRSTNGGESWEECPSPSFPALESGEGEAPSVDQIWALETGGAEQRGVLWAGTIPGGLFRSTDGGDSWEWNRSLWERPERRDWFGGGYDQPGIHSIWVDPAHGRRITLAVSCGGVWASEDGGASWECRTRGMWAAYMPPEKRELGSIQDPHRLVVCRAHPEVMWVQHHNGIFRTTDRGNSWVELTEARPSTFGFAVAAHPKDPLTAWFVPAVSDECRVPVDGRLVVSHTRDGGQSFEVLGEGLPQQNAYHLVYRHGLAVDKSGERLALGSTTGWLWISEDGGRRWSMVEQHLPPIYCVRFEEE